MIRPYIFPSITPPKERQKRDRKQISRPRNQPPRDLGREYSIGSHSQGGRQAICADVSDGVGGALGNAAGEEGDAAVQRGGRAMQVSDDSVADGAVVVVVVAGLGLAKADIVWAVGCALGGLDDVVVGQVLVVLDVGGGAQADAVERGRGGCGTAEVLGSFWPVIQVGG